MKPCEVRGAPLGRAREWDARSDFFWGATFNFRFSIDAGPRLAGPGVAVPRVAGSGCGRSRCGRSGCGRSGSGRAECSIGLLVCGARCVSLAPTGVRVGWWVSRWASWVARAWSCGARTSAVVCFNWRLARRVCGLGAGESWLPSSSFVGSELQI